MSKFKPWRVGVIAAGLAVFLGLLPALSWGKVLLDEDYEQATFIKQARGRLVRQVGEKKGFMNNTDKDSYVLRQGGVEYGSTGLSENGGAVQLLIARQEPGRLQDFLMRVDGGFRVYAEWVPDKDSYITIEGIEGEGYKKGDNNNLIWGWRIPMGFNAPVGQWLVLTLSWGPTPQDNRVYINNQPLTAAFPADFSPRLPVFDGVPRIYLGHDSEILDFGPKTGLVNEHTYGTLLGGITVYDAAISPKEIEKKVASWIGKEFEAEETDVTTDSIEHDASRVAGFSGKLVAGDELTVTMERRTGGEATFDIARLADDDGNISLDWKGWGVYLDEDKVFFDDDEVDLRDVEEYRIYVSKEPITEITEEMEPVETLEVQEQSYLIEDLEEDVPYYTAVVAAMDDDSIKPIIMPKVGIPMAEDVELQPGLYTGMYEVAYGDIYPRAVVVGHFVKGERSVTLAAEEEFEIDSSLNIDVVASEKELKADEESTAKITVTVTDANGDAIQDHKVKFLLATTSQYTGVVGGGTFSDEVGGSLDEDFWGETDLFGQVTATYTAGFAAKTAIIVARDMVTNDTGAAYIKTYIQAAAELELEAVQKVAGKALGYAISVTSSDEWLTADGKSTARITATVTKDGDPVEGHNVIFSVTSGTGSVKTVSGTTDDNGRARAIYTAGKKIGMVLVTAVDTTVGIRGSVQIELRSDAPAKIDIKITPEKLPADGHSTADLLVLVTDINDNPNEGVEVEYQIAIGSGRLRGIDELTDKDGESEATYVAGRVPGKVTIEVTVRSTVPTREELRKARDLALTVTDYDFF